MNYWEVEGKCDWWYRNSAREYFKDQIPKDGKKYDLHHVDPTLRRENPERYKRWIPSDLVVMEHNEHHRLHTQTDYFRENESNKLKEVWADSNSVYHSLEYLHKKHMQQEHQNQGEKNGNYGKVMYHNPLDGKCKLFFEGEQPEGWLQGVSEQRKQSFRDRANIKVNCPYCGREIGNVASLTSHMKKSHIEEDGQYTFVKDEK